MCVLLYVAAPQLLTSPESVDVLNGTTALLQCSVSGYPSPSVSWFHNGDMVIMDSRRTIHANGSLIIWSVMLSDMGMYYCVAENELGSEQSDMVLFMVDGMNPPSSFLTS